MTAKLHDNFVEEIGWPELSETIANVYAGLPSEEKPKTRVLTGNYGEAGAIDLYGPAYGLPPAISGVNSSNVVESSFLRMRIAFMILPFY